MKLSDALVRALLELDVRYVFGVSGANIEHLHDAIHRLGSEQLRAVMAKSETGAAFMADSRARVHHTLGVCCTTAGGGMLNMLVGVAESYAESVPVLAIVGQPPLSLHGRGAFQDSSGMGHTVRGKELWSSVSKFAAQVTRADEFFPVLRRALRAALTGRPGPAVLMIPRDVFELEVGEGPTDWSAWLKDTLRAQPVPTEAVTPLWNALRKARAPVLVMGHGVRRSTSGSLVSEFALATGLPVATTLGARGDFPQRAPSCLGTLGVAGHPSVHEYIEHQADLLLFVGTGLSIMTRGPIQHLLDKKEVFFINVDGGDLAANYPNAHLLTADAGEAFRALLTLHAQAPLRCAAPSPYTRRVFRPLLESGGRSFPDKTGLLQSHALALLERAVPQEGHLIYDAGNCAAAALHYGVVPAGVSSTIALGMGGMGYAVGGAIGAQLGSGPRKRTMAFVGDGAFLMSGLEIHTAVELGLPILYVVFNNSGHGMCVTRQKLYFEGRVECSTYPRVDFAQLSRGLGGPERLWVGKASTAAELERCLDEYLASSHLPGVLELNISQEEMPPFVPFLPKDAPTVPAP